MFDKLAEDIEKRYWQKLAWMANKHNYTHGTSAKFSPASRPDKEPDYVSKSDSEYWVSPMGVTRGSDHWGTVGSCDWKLGKNKFPKKKVYGFSPWENFEKKNKSMKKTATFTTRDIIPLQYLKNLSPGKFKNMVNSLPSDQIYRVAGDGAVRSGQESVANAAVGSKKNGFSDILTNESPFNAFIKYPKSSDIDWKGKLKVFENKDNSSILAPTFIGLDSDPNTLIQKLTSQDIDPETLKRVLRNFNLRVRNISSKSDPTGQFSRYRTWLDQVTSSYYHNKAKTPVVKGTDRNSYMLSDIYANFNKKTALPPFKDGGVGNMGIDPDTGRLLIFDPKVTEFTPENIASLEEAMIKTSSALSDVDVSNWDNLSTEERNAIIKLMKSYGT